MKKEEMKQKIKELEEMIEENKKIIEDKNRPKAQVEQAAELVEVLEKLLFRFKKCLEEFDNVTKTIKKLDIIQGIKNITENHRKKKVVMKRMMYFVYNQEKNVDKCKS